MKQISGHTFLFDFYLKYKDFEGSTNVFCYVGKKYIFVCDSFIYPEKMVEIRNLLSGNFSDKRFVLFNSHSDFDHFWGNLAFKDDLIISSCIAKEKMLKNDYSEEQKYFNKPDLIYPNLCFEKELVFTEENVRFFLSVGHTIGSASCFFEDEKILFAGDNLEYPNPYFDKNLLDKHIETIENYILLNPKIIVPGHGDIRFDKRILYDNLKFLKRQKNG